MTYEKRDGRQGFTLIELMIVVAIVGVLAVLAVYGVRRYLADAKTAEARSTVGQIGKLAVAAYERESGDTAASGLGSSSATEARRLCASSTQVPASKESIKNKKYQSSHDEWTGDQTTGWRCLKFTMDSPQYFMYQYVASTTEFTGQAQGDLNGDGTTSTFRLSGAVTSGQVRMAPSMEEIDSAE